MGLLLGYAIALCSPDTFLVTGRILVQIGRETGSARPSMLGEAGTALDPKPRREDINTEAEILGSPALFRQAFAALVAEGALVIPDPAKQGLGARALAALRRVTEALGLTNARPDQERAYERWLKTVQVNAVTGSNVLALDCRTDQPEAGRKLLDRMIELYVQAHIKAFGSQSQEPHFRSEVTRLEQVVLAAEQQLVERRLGARVLDPESERSLLLTRRAEAEAALRSLTSRIAGLEAKAAELNSMLVSQPATSLLQSERKSSVVRDDLEKKLGELEREVVEMELRYPESSPMVARAHAARDHMRELAKGLPAERDESRILGRDPVHTVLKESLLSATAERKALAAEREAVQRSVVEMDQRLAAIEYARVGIASATRTLNEAEKDLALAQSSARLARTNQQLDALSVTNVSVVAAPTILPTPIKMLGLPPRLAIVAAGLLLGAALGIGILVLRSPRAATARPAAAEWRASEGVA